MERKLRITLAAFFFVGITLLFLDFTGILHTWLGWMAHLQFLPAVMALNVLVVLLLIVLTLLFGRIYCSVICPLGVFQDFISWISGQRKKKKYRFSYSPSKKLLRYGVLAGFVLSMLMGIHSLVALLAPYSMYGRIAQNFFQPVYLAGNNVLAYLAERAGSYRFYETEIWIKSLPVLVVTAVMGILIGVLAWKNGRTYCNTICPVGTVLGLLSRYSLFRPVIDTEKCNGCTLCSRHCKASCIDAKEHQIDYSRCVVCMDCIDACKQHAISYRLRVHRPSQPAKDASLQPKTAGQSRRLFLSAAATATASIAIHAQEKKVDGGLATITDKQKPHRSTRIVPPGSLSIRNFEQHCTACQLCVAACPNNVLRPSTSLLNLMQPKMSYERGYCRPECTRCSEVCPTGAIRPITRDEKSATLIGRAVWIKKNCIPLSNGDECGNCARHCPTQAISMVPSVENNDKSPKIPVVNEWKCIGCGTCEYLCPARPFSAIYVEGRQTHLKE